MPHVLAQTYFTVTNGASPINSICKLLVQISDSIRSSK